jgi:hypothetical protein
MEVKLPVLGLIPPAQAVTLLALQISTFSGSENDNVGLWL